LDAATTSRPEEGNANANANANGNGNLNPPPGTVYDHPYFDANMDMDMDMDMQSPSSSSSGLQQQQQQEKEWHLQQLQILQAQEKYQRRLRHRQNKAAFVASLKRITGSLLRTFDVGRKVGTCLGLVLVACYSAVSPRNLPYLEYNQKFYQNLKLASLVVVPPMIGYGWLIVDWNQVGYMCSSTSTSAVGNRWAWISAATTTTTPAAAATTATTGTMTVTGPAAATAMATTTAATVARNGEHLNPDAAVATDPLLGVGGVGSSTSTSTTRATLVGAAIHALSHSLYSSFVFGYLWIFVLEIIWTTVLRLVIFLAWEPDMFGVKLPWSSPSSSSSLSPLSLSLADLASVENGSATATTNAIPSVWILPWVLREYKYRPKRITLLAADILTSCVACPIIEEFVKLRLLQWTMPLSKNFAWVRKCSKHYHKKQKKKMIAEPIKSIDETDESSAAPANRRHGAGSLDGNVTNINPYIAGMLAVSLGIKWADAIRRVCMYTKAHDERKSVYAFLRGIFPVQELCGIMTALRLARRDVLGQKMPLWTLLLPAVIVHAMANLRGTKPIFKWNGSTPWAEMQLSPDLFPGLFSPSALSAMEETGAAAPPPATTLEWFGRAFPKIMWLVILFRVTGYCVKNYFMINRQAMKRATTYAGKHAAFSAELETAEKLKNTKDK